MDLRILNFSSPLSVFPSCSLQSDNAFGAGMVLPCLIYFYYILELFAGMIYAAIHLSLLNLSIVQLCAEGNCLISILQFIPNSHGNRNYLD